MAKQQPTEPKTPRISVLERRLQNPFGQPSAEIRLKDPNLIPRWFNSGIFADKIWQARENGWEGVRPEHLSDPEQVGHFKVSANGFVCRGEREQEVLMCMPRDAFHAIQQAKTKANIDLMKRPGAVKNDVVNAASSKLGDQAADFINRTARVVGDVHDSFERVERLADVES